MYWKNIFIRLIKNPGALISLVILLTLLTAAVLAPFLAPNNPEEVALEHRLEKPSAKFPMGTDNLGRCNLSRLIYGARVSLTVSLAIMGVSLGIGTLIGIYSGYKGGLIDFVVMRLCDIFLAFPSLILALVIIGILGPGLFNVVLAMVAVQWLWYARIIRGTVLSLKEQSFISAAKICGSSDLKIIFKHVLPNLLPQIIVLSTLDLGSTILHLAGYSFLGMGAQPPTPEWGIMINDGRKFIKSAPELMAYPGAAIFLAAVSLNFLGDFFRDIFEGKGITS